MAGCILTGPYKGAPFGLSVVVPAVAGPFDLGNVVVRAAINIDPHTAQPTIVSDPLPTILDGVPLQVQKVNVTVDREGFMFNPTNCAAVGGDAGRSRAPTASIAPVSSRFQAANCASLAFKPSFKVSTQARTSKKNGASLDVKVGYRRYGGAGEHPQGRGDAAQAAAVAADDDPAGVPGSDVRREPRVVPGGLEDRDGDRAAPRSSRAR